MHEFSIMNSIVASALAELEKHPVIKVEEFTLEVGELTFLQEEQMRFAYQVLTEENILKGSKLVINFIMPEVKCKDCDYQGEMDHSKREDYHFSIPIIACPDCGGRVEIVRGKECMVRDIKAVVEEEGDAKEERDGNGKKEEKDEKGDDGEDGKEKEEKMKMGKTGKKKKKR